MSDLLLRLERSIAEGRSLHSYLLTGTDPGLTERAARRLASIMLCGKVDLERLPNDPDYIEQNGAVSIGDFRDILRPEIYRETYGKAGRAVVFLNANLLSPIVQNAMLKVLEEPPENTHFILTGNEYGILPTIRSRRMIIRCASQDIEETGFALMSAGADSREARLYACQSGGIEARALRLYKDLSFRDMRSGLMKAFFAALGGKPDFTWTKTKRERNDHIEANELLLLACHDLLSIKCGGSVEFCTDLAPELKKLSLCFTIGEIGCIIDKIIENSGRLSTNAGGGACFDNLFASLAAFAVSKQANGKVQINKRENLK